MADLFFSVTFGYLLGLALLGYIWLLASIRLLGKHRRWQKWTTTILVATHFTLGIGAVLFVPARYYRNLEGTLANGGGIAFALTGFVMLCVVLIMARMWNRMLKKVGDIAL